MKNFNETEQIHEQYKTSANLNSRMRLHQLYSTNQTGWSSWVFNQYRLSSNQSVLELGCGTGYIWHENSDKIPDHLSLILSDFSNSMLESAKTNTSELRNIDYHVIDAQAIPFKDNSFDVVIANHMLYHVPDIDKALKEITRVLKAEGIFYATTLGENNMKELVSLLFDFDGQIDLAMDSVTNTFGLESGKELLSSFFESVEMRRYEDSLHITEPQPLIDYILSTQGIGNVTDIITGDRVKEFENYIIQLFNKKGYIDIVKDAGMIISQSK